MSDWKSGLKSFGDKSKSVAKSGWHPEKSGTTLKGQVVSHDRSWLEVST
jgi:hypothetical protein